LEKKRKNRKTKTKNQERKPINQTRWFQNFLKPEKTRTLLMAGPARLGVQVIEEIASTRKPTLKVSNRGRKAMSILINFANSGQGPWASKKKSGCTYN
jgi:hypothetical protein